MKTDKEFRIFAAKYDLRVIQRLNEMHFMHGYLEEGLYIEYSSTYRWLISAELCYDSRTRRPDVLAALKVLPKTKLSPPTDSFSKRITLGDVIQVLRVIDSKTVKDFGEDLIWHSHLFS